MRILGIDPGTQRCGYGLVDAAGSVVRAKAYGLLDPGTVEDAGCVLLSIKRDLDRLIVEHKPDRLGVEKLFFSKNVTTAMRVAEARGVILLAAAEHGVELVELSPQDVKIALTGYGAADKKQVGLMVQRILGLEKVPKPDDVADALAVAVAAGRMPKTNDLKAGLRPAPHPRV